MRQTKSPAVVHRSLAPDERGMALALVLFALVIMGALLSGSFLAVRLDRNSSTATVYAGDAQAAAEAGITEVWTTWDPSVNSVMTIWDGTPATELGTPMHALSGTTYRQVADSVRRLNSELFLVRSFGQRTNSSGAVISQLGVAQLFRIVKPTISVNAAVTTMDPLTLNGNSFLITGVNTLPDTWGVSECPDVDNTSNLDDVVGIRSATTTGVSSQDLDNVYGYPTKYVDNDPGITNSTFQNYLDYTYATLATQPNVKVLPSTSPYSPGPSIDATTSPTSCLKSDANNLGEPLRGLAGAGIISQCYGYFPVVHGTGSRTKFASNARGQGVLLVDGDLEMAGGFSWDGLIIVKGAIKVNGTGNLLTGAVFAQGVDILTAGSISGNVEIKYSQCAISKAVGGATLATPLGQRSFMHLY